MSGYKDDIVSILKHNNMYHNLALGFISGILSDGRMGNLLDHLHNLGLKVSGKRGDATWDYIVIPNKIVSARTILMALSSINAGGIVILEISEAQRKYQEKYLRIGTNQSATKVNYEDRYYLIIHTGEDYGH